MRAFAILFLLGVLPVTSAAAQATPDAPSAFDISYDDSVTETITNAAIFDWWTLQAQQGDVIVVDMVGSDGLAPLIGILSPGGNLVACSGGSPPDDCGLDSQINGKVSVEYIAQDSGPHQIVATRKGNASGTTTGSYQLLVRRANNPEAQINPLQEVVFRCDDFQVTTVATLYFADDMAQAEYYRLSVYGLNGFSPVIRINLSEPDITDCSQDSQAMAGDEYTLPGEETRIVQENNDGTASQITIRSANLMGLVTLTVGSKHGAPGRYMLVIEGLKIAAPGDVDNVRVRLGPLARDTVMWVYMIGGPNSRLDPYLQIYSEDPDQIIDCDDAGRPGCEDVPPFTGAGVKFNDGPVVKGDRLDAGLRLAPGNPDSITLLLSSRDNRTYGDYALVVIGELPPRP